MIVPLLGIGNILDQPPQLGRVLTILTGSKLGARSAAAGRGPGMVRARVKLYFSGTGSSSKVFGRYLRGSYIGYFIH
jgi:hypothetical protein